MDDSGSHLSDKERSWRRLTEKQRACLDLLLEHKTSKEIARLLDISKHTVDQRLNAARDTLGAQDRNETAFLYGQLNQIYDRVTYDAAEVPDRPPLVRSDFQDGSPPNLMELHDSSLLASGSPSDGSPFRDLWRRDHKASHRMWITMVAVAIAILIALGGLSIGQTLTGLLSH
jgi:DNA-binding CsgD family transcriptional regulator